MSSYCPICGTQHDTTACPTVTTTTDPTPETAKDRQIIFWRQQLAASNLEIERLQACNELLERLYEAVNTYKAGRYNWRAPRAKLWMAVEEAIAAIQTGDDQG